MKKIMILALREYRTAIRTKAFIIGLVVAPIFMGGSLIVFALFKDMVDVSDKTIIVMDQSGFITDA